MTPAEMIDRLTALVKEWNEDYPLLMIVGEMPDAENHGCAVVIGGGPDINNTIYDHLIVRAAAHLQRERGVDFSERNVIEGKETT